MLSRVPFVIEMVKKNNFPGQTYWYPPGLRNIMREGKNFVRFTYAVARRAQRLFRRKRIRKATRIVSKHGRFLPRRKGKK